MSSYYFLVGIVFAVVAAIIARGKGRNTVGWFLAGLIVGPFGLVAALLPPKARQGQFAECPHCREIIQAEAVVCRYCGSRFEPT